MSESLERLGRRQRTARELLSIVRVMRAYAMAAVGPYMQAVEALEAYDAAIDQALSVCLQRAPGLAEAPRPHAGRLAIVAFGSDQGLVGGFNEQVAELVESRLAASSGELWVIGTRLDDRLGTGLAHSVHPVPDSVDGIAPLVGELVRELEAAEPSFGSILLVHHQPVSKVRFVPRILPLLPLDPGWLEALRQASWPGRNVPELVLGAERTFWLLVREHLFIALFRACAESLASENASRLAAMSGAERNVREHLDALRRSMNQKRQADLSEELFDIVAAVEALWEPSS